MIAVIFELEPKPGRRNAYLSHAAALGSMLAGRDGFVSIERFESLSQPGRLLSLSFWRDEEAVKAWRTQEQHRVSQSKGRADIFKDYRLRVAAVLRDYGMHDRDQAPADSVSAHGPTG